MATSASTSDVVNWAYQYSLASAKLSSAQANASSSATRSKDIAEAQASFNATMKSLVPSDVQSSVQFQYYDAYTSYNTALAAASTEKERQAALDGLYSTLGGLTLPTPTSSTLDSLLSDTLTAQQTNLSNAAANIKAMAAEAASMASNAGAAWISTVSAGANAFNAAAASNTETMKTFMTSLGLDVSNVTAPEISTAPASAFAAASASAAVNGTPGTIMNAALIGYLVASQATTTDSS